MMRTLACRDLVERSLGAWPLLKGVAAADMSHGWILTVSELWPRREARDEGDGGHRLINADQTA